MGLVECRLSPRHKLLRALVNDALGIILPDICQFEGHVAERNHMTAHVEQLEFQAEARQLLDLLAAPSSSLRCR
jgi:hypothetical protein